MPHSEQKVAIVDDTPLLCRGIRSLLESSPELAPGVIASTPTEAIEALKSEPPDLIICEVVFRCHEGIFEFLRDLHSQVAEIPVLAYSHFDERAIGTRVLKAGARGYLMKSASERILLSAIHKILSGHVYLSSQLTELALGRLSGANHRQSDFLETDILSNRELEVLELVGDGLSSKDVASALHISLKTVESHRANLRYKLGLENSAALICYASRWRGLADHRAHPLAKVHKRSSENSG